MNGSQETPPLNVEAKADRELRALLAKRLINVINASHAYACSVLLLADAGAKTGVDDRTGRIMYDVDQHLIGIDQKIRGVLNEIIR